MQTVIILFSLSFATAPNVIIRGGRFFYIISITT
nr:MAG TPA: hypothetical protein [Caudoviricetes sp.]